MHPDQAYPTNDAHGCDPELALRRAWTEGGVPQDRQDELIAETTAKARGGIHFPERVVDECLGCKGSGVRCIECRQSPDYCDCGERSLGSCSRCDGRGTVIRFPDPKPEIG